MSDSKQKLQRKLPEIASVVQYNYNFKSAKKGEWLFNNFKINI